MDSFNSHPNGAAHDDSHSPPGVKRQRAKQACEPCRLRKRKCDGAMPCNMCAQFEYRCYFEKHPRKRSKIVEANAHLGDSAEYIKAEPSQEDRPSVEEMAKMKSMEANSGIAFTRLLGKRLDPTSGPKLFTFGWNLGSATFVPPKLPPVTDYLSGEQMLGLARLYFENVNPLYGILDEGRVMEDVQLRWTQPEKCRTSDHLFAGIAVGGTLFSDGSLDHRIPPLVALQKRALETSLHQMPCLEDVQSWLVRSLYMRATDHPHAVHMASCTVLHLVEALGLHQEAGDCAMHPDTDERKESEMREHAELRRRTFWVARLLNTWVSFEYGRTRVQIRGITAELPTPREGDYTADYVNLYSLSCILDPERSENKWEDFLLQLENYEARHDALELSRCNLAMCGYRRLRLASPVISNETINRVIGIGLCGLAAARRMTERSKPWWHAANVPFQVICVLLAMDVKESLKHVSEALRVLEQVSDRFRTIAVKEALKTARFLVRLSKKRKDEDSDVLGQSLVRGKEIGDPQPESLATRTQGLQGMQKPMNGGYPSLPGETPKTPRTMSSDDWNLEFLEGADFDWNSFLTNDMSQMNGFGFGFAPDGIM